MSRNLKLIFRVEDNDSKEVVFPTSQMVLYFDDEKLDALVTEARAKFPTASEADLRVIVNAVRLGFVSEILDAAGVVLAHGIRERVLQLFEPADADAS